MDEEIDEAQAGFRPGTGTKNQNFNLKIIVEKNRKYGNNIYLCFIDYSIRLFTWSLIYGLLWNTMKIIGFSEHRIN